MSPFIARGAALAAILATAACGGAGSTTSSAVGSSSGASGSSGSSSSGSASSSGSGSSGSGSSSSGGASSSGASASSGGTDAACAGTSSKAKRQPLDIYIMLDQSGSMGDYTGGGSTNKWEDVTAALSSFVTQPMDGTSVGLQYFGLPAKACSSSTRCSHDFECDACGGVCNAMSGTCFDLGWATSSCNAADYAKPEVEIGLITQTASRIRDSMSQHRPKADTPTSAALQGAVDHAHAWASAADHAGHAVVVVLATDGDPSACDTDLGHIDAIAASGVSSSPGIRTFVIGVGDLRSNLDGIANAGGTGTAFIVDTGADVNAQFLKALNDIRGEAVGCSYAIPPPPSGQTLDYGKVNVNYRPGGPGALVSFGQVADAAACGGLTNAWHYDVNAPPTSIVLCPQTCAVVEADAAASVDVVLGCGTVIAR